MTQVTQSECSMHHLRLENQRMERENVFLNDQDKRIRGDKNTENFAQVQVELLKKEIEKIKQYHKEEAEGFRVKINGLQTEKR